MSGVKKRKKIKQLLSEGEIEEGLALVDKKGIQFLFDIAPSFWYKGERKTAERIFTRIIELAPDNAAAWLNKGLALQTFGQRKKALHCYAEAVKVDPQNDGVWYTRGFALSILGEYEEAVTCFDEVLRLNPHHEHAQAAKRHALKVQKDKS